MDTIIDLTDDVVVDLSTHRVAAVLENQNTMRAIESPGKENRVDMPDFHGVDDADYIKRIKFLQQVLRGEETKLLLLKKIRSSQTAASSSATKTSTSSAAVVVNGIANGSSHQRATQYNGNAVAVTAVQNGNGRPGISSLLKPKSVVKTPLVGVAMRIVAPSQVSQPTSSSSGGSSRSVPRPDTGTSSYDSRSLYGAPVRPQGSVVNGGSYLGRAEQQVRQAGQNSVVSDSRQHLPYQKQNQFPSNAAATEAQKQQQLAQQQKAAQVTAQQLQANAKQALRKQLEMTLLQIPPPKPPPPTLNLIPNGASAEFVILLGLDECVRSTEKDASHPESTLPRIPPICSQCGTDYTPEWTPTAKVKVQGDECATAHENMDVDGVSVGGDVEKVKREGKAVLCANCVAANHKKLLKQEHTNRLKSAFVKALQQERDIEQSLQSTLQELKTQSVRTSTTTQQLKYQPSGPSQQVKVTTLHKVTTPSSGHYFTSANDLVSRSTTSSTQMIGRQMPAHLSSSINQTAYGRVSTSHVPSGAMRDTYKAQSAGSHKVFDRPGPYSRN